MSSATHYSQFIRPLLSINCGCGHTLYPCTVEAMDEGDCQTNEQTIAVAIIVAHSKCCVCIVGLGIYIEPD